MPNHGFSDDIFKILFWILFEPYDLKLKQQDADNLSLGGSPALQLAIKIMGYFLGGNHYNSKEKFSKTKLHCLFYGSVSDFKKLIEEKEVLEEDLQMARSEVKEILEIQLGKYSALFEQEEVIEIKRKRKMKVKLNTEKRDTIYKIVFEGELARRDKVYKAESPTNESSPQRQEVMVSEDGMNERMPEMAEMIESNSFQNIRDLPLLSSFHSEENIFSFEGEIDESMEAF